MEDMVSVLSWECWLCEDAIDITDWARLLLTGSGPRRDKQPNGADGVHVHSVHHQPPTCPVSIHYRTIA